MPAGVPQPGDIVAEKYRIEQVLGTGGMGVVLSALHLRLEERVALKVLLPEAAEQPDAAPRFVREARAACRIKSDHVCRVSDVGILESGAPYLVMEYLEGRDLAKVLASDGPLAIDQAVDFVLQACEAIAEAHVLGIVHRDLKPANLFLTRRLDESPWIKVLDFGISKVVSAASANTSSSLTQGAILGSPRYMSPEQLRAVRDIDARADVWALGVIAYELLSGVPPFRGETLPEVSVKIAVDQPAALTKLRRGLPAGLEAAVLACLEKDRERRLQNVAELAAALAPYGPPDSRAAAERIQRVLDSGRRARGETSEARRPSVTALTVPVSLTRGWRRPQTVGVLIALVLGTTFAALQSVRAVRSSTERPRAAAAVDASAPVEAPLKAVGPEVVPVEASPPVVQAAGVVQPGVPAAATPAPSASSRNDAVAAPATSALAGRPARAATSASAAASAPSSVELISTAGGYVLVDGRPLGAPPVRVPLPPGEHVAKFVHEGRSATRVFKLEAGQHRVIRVEPADFPLPNPYLHGSGPEARNDAARQEALATLDRAVASREMHRAAANAKVACANPVGPSGATVVRVTFSPDGGVHDARISGGDLAGTEVGECVARAFRGLRVPRFFGDPVTIALNVSIK